MPFSHNLLKVISACNLFENGGADGQRTVSY